MVGCERYRRVAPQKQGISDETHSQLHAEPNDHQKELEKAEQQREHADGKKSANLRERQEHVSPPALFRCRRNSQA